MDKALIDSRIEKLIEETIISSSRGRKIILLIMFTCVMAFIAMWNSRDKSWISTRYHNHMKHIYMLTGGISHVDSAIANIYACFNDTLECLPTNEQTWNYLKQRHIYNEQKLNDSKALFEELRRKAYTVTIPILGISFDINDLCMFSGIALSLLLLLFWFCLDREEENLDYTLGQIFHYATLPKEEDSFTVEDIEYYYNRIGMGQVLSLPPKTRDGSAYFWKFLSSCLGVFSKLPIITPFLTLAIIFWHDNVTVGYAQTVNVDLANWDSKISLLSVIVVGLLSVLCLFYSVKVDRTWKDYKNRLDHLIVKQKQEQPSVGS